jgi:tetratricopeptide (TPR) repeat protein
LAIVDWRLDAMTKSDRSVGETTATAALESLRALIETDPEAALRSANELLISSQMPGLLRLVAEAQRRLSNPEAAQAADMLAVEASFADPRLQKAEVLAYNGRCAESAAVAANHLESNPDDLLALTLLGEAHLAQRRLTHAEDLGRQVFARVPRFLRGRILLARSLTLQSRLREATELFGDLEQLRPDQAQALEFLASLEIDAGRFYRATEIYKRILETHGSDAGLWVNYGLALRFSGRKDDAVAAFREALRLDNMNGVAWWSIAGLTGSSLEQEDIGALKQAIASSRRDPANASHLHSALGTLLDRFGEYEQAFRHFAASNDAARDLTEYHPELVSREVDKSIATFTKGFFAEREQWGEKSDSPIFLVGMPRSGSTLVERVLGGHSQIEAAGELQIIPRLVDQLDLEAGRAGGYRELLAKLPRERIRCLGKQYLERSLEFRRTNKRFFTDKLHINWRNLGLIRLILPDARIIDVRRNAIDCCWSNFKTLIARGHPASHDLRHIARFYRDYRRLGDHFERLFPNDLQTVYYEEVVEELEVQTRRMLEFLGLEFEAGCLQFHLLTDPVATASAEQVRRPLNREGIGAWRNYAQWLEPMIDELGPFASEEDERV